MPYQVSDTEHYARCLRTFAVMLQRGQDVTWQEYNWPDAERGTRRLTFIADELAFWKVFKELHPD